MNDPRHAKQHACKNPSSLWSQYVHCGGLAPLIVLLLVIGAEGGAYFYGKIALRLDREGIITTGTVLAVERYEDETPDPKSGFSRTTVWTVVDYSFQTEAGETIRDQWKSKKVRELPSIGSTVDVRYAKSNPNVHEARIGHYQSNTDAMHWIAAAFAGVALLCMAIYFVQALRAWREA